jgi:hypothetical protein
MFFVTLHKPYKGQIDTILIRADLIMEISTRRHRKKDDEYIPFPDDPPREPGQEKGTWVLVDRLGWTPCIETPEEVKLAMTDAEIEYRRRLAPPTTG